MKEISQETIIKIPFFDVDPMNVAWHGNYVKYLEIARCNLLDKIGYNYNQMVESGYSWPVVTLNIKYIQPLIFAQEIKIVASLIEYENCLKIKYLISDLKSGAKLTKAETMQIAVNMQSRETCFVSPQILLKKIQEL